MRRDVPSVLMIFLITSFMKISVTFKMTIEVNKCGASRGSQHLRNWPADP